MATDNSSSSDGSNTSSQPLSQERLKLPTAATHPPARWIEILPSSASLSWTWIEGHGRPLSKRRKGRVMKTRLLVVPCTFH
ncbi:hypothetical protein D8674_033905 [Pyrus ussuriensis x Pyrus communis]|uniref:Uncharacterized protein n=1 Tax=Pyrus ussuriensis x Pyrus communis TaxID=2448454 RepID=A0A5N5HU92_9ROSA|nr:hypothetical protein D8674_033905 [Pyrus ussuriensis x Pyrus communis]